MAELTFPQWLRRKSQKTNEIGDATDWSEAADTIERQRIALEECEEYFDQRADAEYFPDSASPVGNEEMRLLVMVREALGKMP